MPGDIPPQDQRAFNRRLIESLESLDIRYAIGGSIAAMAYSEPRYTVDVDLMVQIDLDNLRSFIEHIEGWGVYVDPFETVLEYNLPNALPISIVDGFSSTKADIYVARDTGLDVSAMQRRAWLRMYETPPLDAWFLAPEDVILYKLDYYRQSEGNSPKHPIDIARMLVLVGNELDRDYLTHWANEIGVLSLWNALWDEFQARPQRKSS